MKGRVNAKGLKGLYRRRHKFTSGFRWLCVCVCVSVCVCAYVCVCVCVLSISIYASLGEWFSSTSNGHYTPGTGTIMLQYSFISYLFCSLSLSLYSLLSLFPSLSLCVCVCFCTTYHH